MKNVVGIVTYSGNNNYGSLLQAFAMKQILNKREMETVFLLHDARTWRWRISLLMTALLHPGVFTRSFLTGKQKKSGISHPQFKAQCQAFIRRELKPKKLSWDALIAFANQETTLCCICGSDQIWNMVGLYVDAFYFLQFAPVGKRLAYAPSFGEVEVQHFLKRRLGKFITAIPYLSVRENTGAWLIKEVSGRDAPVLTDPVFLLTREEWHTFVKVSNDKHCREMVILYFLNTPSDIAITVIKKYVKKTHCKVYALKNNYMELSNMIEDVILAEPLEFVGILSEARCVFTDSFHGTAFSIIMNTPFFTFSRQYQKSIVSGDERVQTLLSKLDLEKRLIFEENDDILLEDVDFHKVDILLENERKASLDYLINSLNIVGT